MKRFALLLCLAVVLTGCGGSPSSPVALPPVSPSPSTSTAGTSPAVPVEPSGSAPAAAGPLPAVRKPPEADAPTSDGAAAFVRYYVDVINEATVSNDTRLLESLSDPECEGCNNYIRSIKGVAAEHGRVDPGGGIVVKYSVAPPLEEGETIALLDFDATDYVERDPDGKVLHRAQPVNGLTAELRCVRTDGSWKIHGFRRAEPG